MFMEIKILAQKFYDYSSYIRGYSKPTLKRYRQVINYFCAHAKVEQIEEVSPDNVRGLFYEGRIERHWTPNTFICYLKSLLVFFRWCQKEGYMKTNPAEDIEKPKIEKRLPVKLTRQDADKLLEVAYNYPYDHKFLRYRNHAIFATFLMAGIRKKELLNLKFADVDVENLSVFIRQGKGSKDRIVPICYKLAGNFKEVFRRKKTA